MKPTVFIDGHSGSTGLRIHEWLERRGDVTVHTLADHLRKDPEARRQALRAADLAILCLPDAAAREAATWLDGADTRLIDASTAHRVDADWIYGVPELGPHQRAAIREARRVSNPGCYPTSVVLLIRPLIDAGLIDRATPLTVHALSGYSGGGRALIEKWEDQHNGLLSLPFEAPYALAHPHKHLPEMTEYSGLSPEPQFVPAVGPFRCGMRVQIPLHTRLLNQGADAKRIWEALCERYDSEAFVRLAPLDESARTNEHSFDPQRHNDTNTIELHVLPHPSGHVLLMGILDNLGKGASGAAVQNMNLMLGFEEGEGLPRYAHDT